MKRTLGRLIIGMIVCCLVSWSGSVGAASESVLADIEGGVSGEVLDVLVEDEDAVDDFTEGELIDEVEAVQVLSSPVVTSDILLDEIEVIDSKSKLLISEVQLRGRAVVGDSDSSFVEIYNGTDDYFTEVGWRLEFVVSNDSASGFGGVTVLAELDFSDLDFEPRGYLVLGADEMDDIAMARISNGSRGYIRIVDSDGRVVDLIGYGTTAQSSKAEGGLPVRTPASGKSMQRCENELGLIVDTDVNADDFLVDGKDVSYPVTPGYGLKCATFEEEPFVENLCFGLRLNEIGANLDAGEQFIEVRNSTGEVLDISGCGLKTNRSAKIYVFDEIELSAGELMVVVLDDTDLILTKTTSGAVYLLDSGENEIDEVGYNGLKAGTSWALFGDDWKQTYTVTGGSMNAYTEYAPCAIGYERNLETGRCRKIVVEDPPADCGPGKFRNPETGRCKSYSSVASVLAPCKEGYYRNPETNRCKKIETSTASVLAPCREGYERNPETNRCRKIRENNGADFGVVADSVGDESAFVGWWALVIVVGAGLAYIGWQFRGEIGGLGRRVLRKKD